MSRIVVFGITNLNFENLTDPSIKVYLVGTDYDYEDDDSKAIISVQTKNILDFYIDENLEESEIPTIFVDCTGSSKTYIDVMYRLKTARFDKRTYLVGPSIDTDKILDIGKLKFEEHFNPFDGDEIPKGFKEKEYLLNFFKTCSNVIYYYLKCGFDKKEINDIPPGWSINLSTKELNSLCRYYGLWTAAPDVSPILDFSQNSQYRQIVLETLIAVTSNFVIRNKLVNIAEVENWNDPETWKMVWETKF